MDCPQCGDPLETYTLQSEDREASVCRACGFVGIPAEHRGEPTSDESWHDALRRFYRARGTDDDPRIEIRPSRPTAGGESESWDDAIRRFRARLTDDGDERKDETDDGADGDDPDDSDAVERSSQSSAGDS
jgi:hypothetical protein